MWLATRWPAVDALHGGGGHAHVELATDEGVRDGVVVLLDLDVVVDVDSRFLPLGKHVALCGKGAKRGTVELLEQLTAASPGACGTGGC